MDIIEMTRELGKAIQQDERYKALRQAHDVSDKDQELQDLIGEFNLKRMAISNEAGKEDRDDGKMQQLNEELRAVYGKVMLNPNMMAYNQAKEAMDELLQRVSAIISLSADGGDPETADYEPSSCGGDPETADYEPSSCGGDCSGCSGCH